MTEKCFSRRQQNMLKTELASDTCKIVKGHTLKSPASKSMTSPTCMAYYWHARTYCTCDVVEAGLMEYSGEHFEADNRVNDNDKEHEEGDVKQRNHGHQNGIYDNL